MSRAGRILPPSWLLWPFYVLWRLAGFATRAVGSLLAIVLGLVFMGLGLLLTSTIVGAIVGIPMLVFGFLLLIKGLF